MAELQSVDADCRVQAERPERRQWTPRSIELLRSTLSMLCHFDRRLRQGEHLWSIPVDTTRDFDCILSDAILELEELRKLQQLVYDSAVKTPKG